MANKSLFPPILNSYMPAFKKRESLKIYFKLSTFNSRSDFNSIHVSINRLDNNQSALNRSLYPNNIIMFNGCASEEGKDFYYIEIPPTDIQGGWEERCLYKIQLRLSSKQFTNEVIGESNWLANNQDFFSEWSTVSITKCIGDVSISVPLFESMTDSTSSEEMVIYLTSLVFEGNYLNTNDTSEPLEKISLELKDEDGNVLEKSGEITCTKDNTIKYYFYTKPISSKKYILSYKAETKNCYVLSNSYTFTTEEITIGNLNCEIFCSEEDREEDEENGVVTIHVVSMDNAIFSGNINIQRASSKDNFLVWEDILKKPINGEILNLEFKDYTIESGVFYKYAIRKVDYNLKTGESFGSFEYMAKPVVRLFNHCFLLGKNGKQLKLSLNPQINSFQSKVVETTVETIGSVFPTVSRNGRTKYKTFPFTGTLSFEQDESFLEEDETLKLSQEILSSNELAKEYSYTKERLFREKALDFLQDFSPKLFKSDQEGNIIVIATDVSFTPKNEIGRLVYDISCTFTEIEKNTNENRIKNGFFTLEEYGLDFTTKKIKIGQIQEEIPTGVDVVETFIRKKYEYKPKKDKQIVILGYKYDMEQIKRMKIEFISPPMLIKDQNNRPMLGYKINLNGKDICIDRNGYYVVDERVKIDNLFFYGDLENKINKVKVNLNFTFTEKKSPKPEKVIKSRSSKTNVGQFVNSVSCGAQLYNTLYYKYYFEGNEDYQRLTSIKRFTVEGVPGTTLWIKDYKDNKLEKHIIGETGVLNFSEFNNNNIIISNFGLYGKYYGEEEDFTVKSKEQREKEDKKTLYTDMSDNLFVWDYEKFVPVEIEDGKIFNKTINLDLLVDYIYTIERGKYYPETKS